MSQPRQLSFSGIVSSQYQVPYVLLGGVQNCELKVQADVIRGNLVEFVQGPNGSQMEARVQGELDLNSNLKNSSYLRCFRSMKTNATYTKTGQDEKGIYFNVEQKDTEIAGLPPGLNGIAAQAAKEPLKCMAKPSQEGEEVIAECQQHVYGQSISFAMKLRNG